MKTKVTAIVFVKDDQSVWSKDLDNGKQFHSVCVEVNASLLNLETLVENNEKSMVWLKSEDKDRLVDMQQAVIGQIKSGLLMPYRAFSKTPFYEGQAMDINPQTEETLDRYSQVKLCPASKHAELHRQYVDVNKIEEKPPVGNPEPKITA